MGLGVLHIVKKDEAAYPFRVSFLGPDAVVPSAEDVAELVEQFRFWLQSGLHDWAVTQNSSRSSYLNKFLYNISIPTNEKQEA
jgi:hypothetical protein